MKIYRQFFAGITFTISLIMIGLPLWYHFNDFSPMGIMGFLVFGMITVGIMTCE